MASSSPSSSVASLSSLPTELLTHILSLGFSSDFDLPYLWCSLRHVSHRFRRVIEDLVSRLHLRKCYLVYSFANPEPNQELREAFPTVKFWMRFKGLASSSSGRDDNAGDVAVFVPDEEINGTGAYSLLGADTVFGAWDPVWLRLLRERMEAVERDGQVFVRPAHMFSVCRLVNDTELCGFEICTGGAGDDTGSETGTGTGAETGTAISQHEPWEIRIRWKETISKLMLEEKLRWSLSRRWIREQRARSSGLSEKPLHDLHHAMKLHLLSHRMTRDESFSVARRKRVTAQYKAAGLDFNTKVLGNRELALAMRRKTEEIEDHQSYVNQFSFE